MDTIKKETTAKIIEAGKLLYDKGLVVGRSGNMSARLTKDQVLISGHGTCLGFLKEEDFAVADFQGTHVAGAKLSTETPIHAAIYRQFNTHSIIHAHPPLTSAYFAARDTLEPVTFETKLYLGNVPVVEQDTPSITKMEPVIEALKLSNIVVLKNHGVIAIGNDLMEGFFLIEELEAACKMSGFLISLTAAQAQKQEGEPHVKTAGEKFDMFSPAHIRRIVDLANEDGYIQEKGAELDLTTQVVIKLDESSDAYTFIFDKGKIVMAAGDEQAPFIISGKKDVWRLIFEGKLDPFVATTQGKLRLKGDFGKISKWYAPFNRLFAIFKQVGIL